MSTITRRRVAGASTSADDGAIESTSSQGGSASRSQDNLSPSSEKKVAYDPRDVDESKSTPKLTLMEEVLLLGLKDRQVLYIIWIME